MSAERPIPAGSRPRALAELPVEALVARAEELAKEWVIALISARPLAELDALPLQELAQDAPGLLAQAIRAIGEEEQLDRLTAAAPLNDRGQAGRALAAVSTRDDAAATVGAVEALRGVLWHGVLLDRRWQASGDAAIRQLSDLAERVAFVCAEILAAALERDGYGAEQPSAEEPASTTSSRAEHGRTEVAARAARGGAVIIDEHEQPVSTPTAHVQRTGPGQAERPSSWDLSPPMPPRVVSEGEPDVWEQPPPGASVDDEIAIRDARREEGPAAWIGSIGRQLQIAQEDGRPFAVLLVEPCEIEHWRAGDSPTEIQRLSQELEDALALAFGASSAGARVGDTRSRGALTRERPGRYWLLSPETDRAGAASLVERLCRAVSSVVEHRGERVELVIGIAICPEDGRTPAALAAHADVSLYASRSAARAARGPRATVRDR